MVGGLTAMLAGQSAEEGFLTVDVVTDDKENASQEYTADAVRQVVTEQTDRYGWDFVFLGANQDAVDGTERQTAGESSARCEATSQDAHHYGFYFAYTSNERFVHVRATIQARMTRICDICDTGGKFGTPSRLR